MSSQPIKENVLIITYYWPPSGGAGVQRWLKMVKYLPEFGIQPIVLTVDPEFAEYPVVDVSLEEEVSPSVPVFRTKSKSALSIYRRFTGKKESLHGGMVNVKKNSWKEELSKFVRGNFFLPDARRGWNVFAKKKAEEIIREFNIKTIITTSPPHSSQLIGLYLKRKCDVNWIVDLRDPWTDIYFYRDLYPTKLARWVDRNYEKDVINQADEIITVSNGMKSIISSKFEQSKTTNVHVIPNGYDGSDFENRQSPKKDVFELVYTGTIAETYDVSALIKALEKLPAVHMTFVGSVNDALRDQLKTSIGNRAKFIGYVPHDQSISYLLQASALLLVIPKAPRNKGIMTGKIFEYLASKKPILCIGPPDGDAANVISECGAGETFDYDDTKGILSSLNKLLEGSQPRFIEEKIKSYSRVALCKQVAGIIQPSQRT